MQSFKIIALLILPDSGRYVKFTLKYTIVRDEGGVLEFFLNVPKHILSVSEELKQSFKIVALLLLTDSGRYVKFTLKYTIVQGEEGVLELFQTYSFGH